MRAHGLLLLAAVALIGSAACSQDATQLPAAGEDGGPGESGLVDPAVLERGEYLVRHVAGCGECHTPRDAQGNLDESHWLAGVANRFDLAPDDDTAGGISAPNLTPAHLAGWSDEQIERAFLDGIGSDGAPLFPLMPYYAYHNMTEADAQAIVVYLRHVPAIAGDTPPRQPLPVRLDAPAPPVPESAIPHTTLKASDPDWAAAERGRYLAGEIGFCLDCHTPWRLGVTPPLDLTHAFAGGRSFSAKDWGVPPPAPAVIESYDITPHANGIAGWTATDVAAVLAHGTTPQSDTLCRPMPAGPFGAFGGILPDDAHDIGVYLTTIPPVDGGDIARCSAP